MLSSTHKEETMALLFWTNPHPRSSFTIFQDFRLTFDFFPRKFAACWKAPSQESATFLSRGPHPNPARFQQATTIPADQKKGFRLKIRHFTANSMAVTKRNNISAGLLVTFSHKKKGRGRDEIAWRAGSYNSI